MKQAPSKFSATELINHGWPASTNVGTPEQPNWVPGRPCGCFGLINRMRLAWAVFRGKADALYWDKQ